MLEDLYKIQFYIKSIKQGVAVKIVDYVIKEMDGNKKVKTPVALFLDLPKAFDILTFDILLKN